MIDSEILFRRRAALFIAVSALLYIALLVGLRVSYKNLVGSVVSEYGRTQQHLVSQMAALAEQDFDLLGWRARQAAALVTSECLKDQRVCAKPLNAQYDLLAADGAKDIVFLDNMMKSRISTRRFFEEQGGWPPEVDRAREKAMKKDGPKVVVSEIFTFTDEDKKERPGVAYAVPVFDLVPEDPSATDTQKILTRIGCVVVPVSFGPVSARIQNSFASATVRTAVMLGPGEIIVSNRDPGFIGASAREIFNFSKNALLENIISRALEGKKGVEEYPYISDAPRQGAARMWMAYAPVRIQGGPYTMALYYKEKDIPLSGNFFWRYATLAVLCLLLLVLLNLLPLIEHKRLLATSVELKRMHDVNAINDMLRSVNSELTETKRALETRTREVHALHEQRLHILEQITNTQYRLFGTIKKPAREQRELMRMLKRDIQAMSRSPEGRFWKKAEAELEDS